VTRHHLSSIPLVVTHERRLCLYPSGSPSPCCLLARRVLPWHLAGEFDGKSDLWNALTHYAITVEGTAAHSDHKADNGWVQVQRLPDGLIEVRAGLSSS
jgi:hypothetical protein